MARSNSAVLLRTAFLLVIITMVMMIIVRCQDLSSSEKIKPTPAPEFTQKDSAAWLNSEPLRISDLNGKLVLIDVWTFECWNCYRSFPWLKEPE